MPKVSEQAPALVSFEARVGGLNLIMCLVTDAPNSWKLNGEVKDEKELSLLHCDSYSELVASWKKALKWTDGLDCGLSVMLASISSTKSVGDQLWVKIIGPASCGKSTLCEAVSTNKEFVLAKSTIRGFHSGMKSDEDSSLVAQVSGKTLVTKDGDTLLQTPNLKQILAEARDLYDSTARTYYRNKAGRDYTGVRMTWILCGTSSLRSIDSSELGERFLDCVIMDQIDDELEDEILWRVANRVDRNLKLSAEEDQATTQQDPDMTNAMRLTGGYISYLRNNVFGLLNKVTMNDETKRKCTRLGKFVAYMRARPSRTQDEETEREFAARLVSQLVRLAQCLSVVIQDYKITKVTMDRVTKVALDTARGVILDIVHQLYHSDVPLEPKAIALVLGRSDAEVRRLLRFLKRLNAVESIIPKVKGFTHMKPKWRLTTGMRELYAEVYTSNESIDSSGL